MPSFVLVNQLSVPPHVISFLSVSALIVICILALIAMASVKARKLTPWGGFSGFVVALLIYAGARLTGVIELSAFFGLGVLASLHKRETKFEGTVQDTAEARTPGQVLANAGMAGLLALLALLFPHQALLFQLMLAGSLASATADTLASELGVVYSRRFYNCITFKKDIKGLDGVISVEGLLFGAAGAFIIALVQAWLAPLVNPQVILVITLAGIIGNYADSILGAALERKHYLNNNWVNFLSTLIAAVSVWLILLI